MDTLPVETLVTVFSFLPLSDCINVAKVCKLFYTLLYDKRNKNCWNIVNVLNFQLGTCISKTCGPLKFSCNKYSVNISGHFRDKDIIFKELNLFNFSTLDFASRALKFIHWLPIFNHSLLKHVTIRKCETIEFDDTAILTKLESLDIYQCIIKGSDMVRLNQLYLPKMLFLLYDDNEFLLNLLSVYKSNHRLWYIQYIPDGATAKVSFTCIVDCIKYLNHTNRCCVIYICNYTFAFFEPLGVILSLLATCKINIDLLNKNNLSITTLK